MKTTTMVLTYEGSIHLFEALLQTLSAEGFEPQRAIVSTKEICEFPLILEGRINNTPAIINVSNTNIEIIASIMEYLGFVADKKDLVRNPQNLSKRTYIY